MQYNLRMRWEDDDDLLYSYLRSTLDLHGGGGPLPTRTQTNAAQSWREWRGDNLSGHSWTRESRFDPTLWWNLHFGRLQWITTLQQIGCPTHHVRKESKRSTWCGIDHSEGEAWVARVVRRHWRTCFTSKRIWRLRSIWRRGRRILWDQTGRRLEGFDSKDVLYIYIYQSMYQF